MQVAVAVAAAEDAAPFSDEETWRNRRRGREKILCESP